ncbi:MAG: rhomboid family intramembrane serine protease [Polyangiaceae bacterium]
MSSRVCPNCGALNAGDEKNCVRCQVPLPGAMQTAARGMWLSALGNESPLTNLYIGLCLLVFVAMTVASGKPDILGVSSGSEALKWGALFTPIAREEPFRYLSATFVHFGLLHIAFNMMALRDLGRAVESRLGSGRFVFIFVVTSVAGFVASDFWYSFRGVPAFTAGASAALFGLIGAWVGYLYAAKDSAWKQFLFRVAVYAAIFAVVWPVNNAAHIGGFLAGAPLGVLFYRERRPWKRAAVFSVIGWLLVIASFGSIVLSHRSDAWQELRRMEIARGHGP